MFDGLLDLLSGKAFVKMGYTCWNTFSDAAMALLGSAPSQIADGSLWNVSMTLMDLMMVIGASLFNLLFFANFCKQSADLRNNQTIETVMTMLIKFILGNFLIVNIKNIINGVTEIMQGVFQIVAPEGAASVALQETSVDDWDSDTLVIGFFVCAAFMIVAIAAGLLLVLHVYGIFIKVFFYIVTGPLVLATVAGPEGASRSAENWFKTILCAFGEFAGTALVLRLCAAIINSNGFLIPVPDWLGAVETLWNMAQSMLTILLAVGSVKAVDSMIRRAFGF
nr:hypothetical protein [uncultured Blautia sp.]